MGEAEARRPAPPRPQSPPLAEGAGDQRKEEETNNLRHLGHIRGALGTGLAVVEIENYYSSDTFSFLYSLLPVTSSWPARTI